MAPFDEENDTLVANDNDNTKKRISTKISDNEELVKNKAKYSTKSDLNFSPQDENVLNVEKNKVQGNSNIDPPVFDKLSNATESQIQIKEYKSGAVFKGFFKESIRVGNGVFEWPNGDIYDGEFFNNVRQGKGKQKWADGSCYSGDFYGDMRHGYGKHIWSNGEFYEGSFFRDTRHGSGNYHWPNGSWYKGKFYTNKKEGYGCFKLKNGTIFKGLYQSDERKGPGVLCYSEEYQDVGIWCREKLIKLCTRHPNAFTLDDFPEFDFDSTEHLKTVVQGPLNNHFYTDILEDIENSQEFYRQEDKKSEKLTTCSKNIERNQDCNVHNMVAVLKSFDDEFYGIVEKNKAEQTMAIKNNTPMLIDIQRHILLHQNSEHTADFPVSDVVNGVRGSFLKSGTIENDSNALLEAAESGNVKEVQELLLSSRAHPDLADSTGYTPLMAASINWHCAVINCLLDNGADVNKLTDDGVSPLAACHIYFYPTECFLQSEADKSNVQSQSSNTFIDCDSKNQPDKYSRVLEKQAKSTNKKTKRQEQIDFHRIEKLWKEYSNDEIKYSNENFDKNIDNLPLNRNKNTDEFIENSTIPIKQKETKSLIKSLKTDADEEPKTNITEFESNLSIVDLPINVSNHMIERCATNLSTNQMVVSRSRSDMENFKQRGTVRQLALDKSRHHLKQKTINLLLSRGADPNASSVPMPVLFFAIKAGDVEAVRQLLLNGASTLVTLSKKHDHLSPLHIAAGLPGEEGVSITKLLLDSLANPDVRASPNDLYLNRLLEEEWSKDSISDDSALRLGGRTPLHIACSRHDNYIHSCQIVELLLNHHADPNLICNGHSPLTLAIISGNDLAIDKLLNHGADTCLSLTHGVGNALCVASSTEIENHWTPSGRLQLIEKLVRYGADILAPIPIGSKRVIGTAVDYAYHLYNQDRRIAHMPYHALTHAERETFNNRRKMLASLSDILRSKAIEKEKLRLLEEENSSIRSRSPSPNFVYTGAGASLPPGMTKGKGRAIVDHTATEKSFKSSRNLSKITENDPRRPLFKYCYECGRSVGVRLAACTRCKEVFYCSKSCKLKAWNARHKDECIRIGNSRSPSPVRKQADSPTPTTNPDKHRIKNNVESLMKNSRIKGSIASKEFSLSDSDSIYEIEIDTSSDFEFEILENYPRIKATKKNTLAKNKKYRFGEKKRRDEIHTINIKQKDKISSIKTKQTMKKITESKYKSNSSSKEKNKIFMKQNMKQIMQQTNHKLKSSTKYPENIRKHLDSQKTNYLQSSKQLLQKIQKQIYYQPDSKQLLDSHGVPIKGRSKSAIKEPKEPHWTDEIPDNALIDNYSYV